MEKTLPNFDLSYKFKLVDEWISFMEPSREHASSLPRIWHEWIKEM